MNVKSKIDKFPKIDNFPKFDELTCRKKKFNVGTVIVGVIGALVAAVILPMVAIVAISATDSIINRRYENDDKKFAII